VSKFGALEYSSNIIVFTEIIISNWKQSTVLFFNFCIFIQFGFVGIYNDSEVSLRTNKRRSFECLDEFTVTSI